MIFTILAGLFALSVVVLIHELGHFFVARAVGVAVETFSIGWGPRLFGFSRKGTEWRISAIPMGGYCKLKGEDSFRQALEQKLKTIPAEPGSYYGVSPLRRIAIALAGPFFNLLCAVLFFAVVASVGMTIHTASNRILLASEYPALSTQASPDAAKNPADTAGLRSGDTIAAIDGKTVRDYADIQELISTAPGKTLRFEVLRAGESLSFPVTPRLDTSTGAGYVGIYAWTDPLVASLDASGAAAMAGMEAGDRILAVDGKPVAATLDFFSALASRPERLQVSVNRGGTDLLLSMVLAWKDSGDSDIGINFAMLRRLVKADSPLQALSMGLAEAGNTLRMTAKSIGLLFSGVNPFKAVSGPARITWMVGKTASEGVKTYGAAGLMPVLNFLAFISVSLGIMNLLPIPVLDGGQILLFIVELVRRKPLKTKTIYRFQFIGAALLAMIFLVATFSDLLFFAAR